jgi:hypothetical protein
MWKFVPIFMFQNFTGPLAMPCTTGRADITAAGRAGLPTRTSGDATARWRRRCQQTEGISLRFAQPRLKGNDVFISLQGFGHRPGDLFGCCTSMVG